MLPHKKTSEGDSSGLGQGGHRQQCGDRGMGGGEMGRSGRGYKGDKL